MAQPPRDLGALTAQLHARLPRMSRVNRAIASYLLEHPGEAALQPLTALGAACGVHGSSLVRFAQGLGFSGFKEMQALFRTRLAGSAPPGGAMAPLPGDGSDHARLRHRIEAEIAALEGLARNVGAGDLSRAADLLAAADVICLSGPGAAAPALDELRRRLSVLGRRCLQLDRDWALARPVLDRLGAGDALVAVGWNHVEAAGLPLAETATRGVAVIEIAEDAHCQGAAAWLSLPPRPDGEPPGAALLILMRGLSDAVAARLRPSA